MTGPEHYAEAERLLTLADRHTRGVTYAEEWTLTLTAAQVHATLALAAATAVGTAGPDLHAWAGVAATKTRASKPDGACGDAQTRYSACAPPACARRSRRPAVTATPRSRHDRHPAGPVGHSAHQVGPSLCRVTH